MPADPVYRPTMFRLPDDVIYLDGNSLGPLTVAGEARLTATLADFARLGVAGWTDAQPPWYTWAESLAGRLAGHFLGARPGEVAVTGQTTINLHQLLATFYRPTGARRRIVIDALAFPTDRYAVRSLLVRLGADPAHDLAVVPSRDGRTLDPADIVAAIDDRTALVVLPSVLFASGQLLDVAAITAHAHRAGALVLFDLSHSVGILPHALDAWGVDLAVWCNYKYLSGGPGTVGGLFVAERLAGADPALAGWWGSAKDRQFGMPDRLEAAPDAGRFQIGTPPVLSLAALSGALDALGEVPVEAVRAASLARTARLIARADERLAPLGFTVVTPRPPGQRGGHVALAHPEAARLSVALRARGVVPDHRPPDIVRLCPHPMYVDDGQIDRAVEILAELTETRAYERVAAPAAVN